MMMHVDEQAPSIIQYWDQVPPGEIQELMGSWAASAQQGFSYRLFDKRQADSFIEQNFDSRTLAAFRTCAIAAMQADFFRYCALIVLPGIYVDADVKARQPIRPLFDSVDRGLLFMRGKKVANDFMIFRNPSDPLLRKILGIVVANIENRLSNNVWEVTGPGVATKLMADNGLNGPDFAGLTVVDIAVMRKHVMFNWDLPYKRSSDHWVLAQAERSIFRNPG